MEQAKEMGGASRVRTRSVAFVGLSIALMVGYGAARQPRVDRATALRKAAGENVARLPSTSWLVSCFCW